jgi:hypothetical protein
MKFHLSSLIGFGGGGGCYSQLANLKKLHKNLFMDDFQNDLANDMEEDEYVDDEESEITDKKNEYTSSIETNSKYFKLNHLSMPLTGNIILRFIKFSNMLIIMNKTQTKRHNRSICSRFI